MHKPEWAAPAERRNMSQKKYERGQRIKNMSEFSRYTGTYYIVKFGEKYRTLHVGFVQSWQYRYVYNLVRAGRVYIAKKIKKK